jgi:hypothetical protein
MRLSVFALLAFAMFVGIGSSLTPGAGRFLVPGTAVVSAAQEQPGVAQAQGKLDVDINVNKGGDGRRWYANPVWIAIGALAFVVLLLVIFMAGRGGGTTVVR